MKRTSVGAALLLLVASVHLGYHVAALQWPADEHVKAAKALQYMARGVEAAVLWVLVYAWSPVRGPVFALACAWGFAQSVLIVACRAALPIGGVAPAADSFRGLCDTAGGALPSTLQVMVCVWVAVVVAYELSRGRPC